MALTLKKRRRQLSAKSRAVEVLRQKMDFYNGKANEIVTEIVMILKQSEISQGKRLVEMYKIMHSHNEIVIDCASKLAPYESSKRASVEVKTEETHRFVIEVPVKSTTKEQWLEQVRTGQLPLPKLNNGQQVVIPPSYNDDDDYEYKHLVEANPN